MKYKIKLMKYTLLKKSPEGSESVFEIQSPNMLEKLTVQMLMDNGYVEPCDPDAKWEPKKDESYWTFSMTRNQVEEYANIDQELTDIHKNAFGVYMTKAEAEASRDKIRAFVANGFK